MKVGKGECVWRLAKESVYGVGERGVSIEMG